MLEKKIGLNQLFKILLQNSLKIKKIKPKVRRSKEISIFLKDITIKMNQQNQIMSSKIINRVKNEKKKTCKWVSISSIRNERMEIPIYTIDNKRIVRKIWQNLQMTQLIKIHTRNKILITPQLLKIWI